MPRAFILANTVNVTAVKLLWFFVVADIPAHNSSNANDINRGHRLPGQTTALVFSARTDLITILPRPIRVKWQLDVLVFIQCVELIESRSVYYIVLSKQKTILSDKRKILDLLCNFQGWHVNIVSLSCWHTLLYTGLTGQYWEEKRR